MSSRLTNAKLTRRGLCCFLAAVSTAFPAGVPKRIVSLSPNTTEILYGVGVFDRVVAVSRYCSYPPEVSKLPRVGGWQDASIESIAAQHPDLVVLTKAQEPFIGGRLRAFGIPSLVVPAESLGDVFTAIDQIGEATGSGARAADLIQRTRSSLDAVRTATGKLARRSVLLVVSHAPGSLSDLYVATEGSYLVDLIAVAGGHSIASPAATGYTTMSKEAVLSLNPDIIIDMVRHSQSRLSGSAPEIWRDLPELKAVKENHIFPVDDEFVPHPSQFVARTAELFESILHPEARQKGTH